MNSPPELNENNSFRAPAVAVVQSVVRNGYPFLVILVIFAIILSIGFIVWPGIVDLLAWLTLITVFLIALFIGLLAVLVKRHKQVQVLLGPVVPIAALMLTALLFVTGKLQGINPQNREWATLAASIVAFLAVLGILISPDARRAWIEAGIGFVGLLFGVALIGASCAVVGGLLNSGPLSRIGKDQSIATSSPTPVPVPTRTTFFLPSEKTQCAKETLSEGQNVIVILVLRETEDNRRVAYRHQGILLGDPQSCAPMPAQGSGTNGANPSTASEADLRSQGSDTLPEIPVYLVRGDDDQLAAEFARQLTGAIAIYILDGRAGPTITRTPTETTEPAPTDTPSPTPTLTPTPSPTMSPTPSLTLTPSITPTAASPTGGPTTPTLDVTGTPTTFVVTPTHSVVVPPTPTDTLQTGSPSPITCSTPVSSRMMDSVSRASYYSGSVIALCGSMRASTKAKPT